MSSYNVQKQTCIARASNKYGNTNNKTGQPISDYTVRPNCNKPATLSPVVPDLSPKKKAGLLPIDTIRRSSEKVVMCEVESYRKKPCLEEADPRSAGDRRSRKILDPTTFQEDSILQTRLLPDNFHSSLVDYDFLKKHPEKNLNLKKQYALDISGNSEKGYVVPVSAQDLKTNVRSNTGANNI